MSKRKSSKNPFSTGVGEALKVLQRKKSPAAAAESVMKSLQGKKKKK